MDLPMSYHEINCFSLVKTKKKQGSVRRDLLKEKNKTKEEKKKGNTRIDKGIFTGFFYFLRNYSSFTFLFSEKGIVEKR